MNRFLIASFALCMGLAACKNRQFNSETKSTENPRSLRGIIPAEISCIEDPNTEKWNYTVRVTGSGSCEMVAVKGLLAPMPAEACSAKTSLEEGGVRYEVSLEPDNASPKRFMNVWFIDGKGEGPALFSNNTPVILKCGFLSGGGIANPQNGGHGGHSQPPAIHTPPPSDEPSDVHTPPPSNVRYKCLGYESTITYSSKEECAKAGCVSSRCIKAAP